jgi:hypothetical protein
MRNNERNGRGVNPAPDPWSKTMAADQRSPSPRAVEAIGRFASFVSALDRGRLRQADREQSQLRRLGFEIDFRPLSSPSQVTEGDQ